MGVLMIIPIGFSQEKIGYIAGKGDGILTVLGEPSQRAIYLLDSDTLVVTNTAKSMTNGHYIFTGLDIERQYMVLARDHRKEYEPFAWDYVTPADDLTTADQVALWESWQ